jgi:hypothetical protein
LPNREGLTVQLATPGIKTKIKKSSNIHKSWVWPEAGFLRDFGIRDRIKVLLSFPAVLRYDQQFSSQTHMANHTGVEELLSDGADELRVDSPKFI